ncbi:penicillin-binding protein activator LpoB [Stutzerimonas urumqiensis]|uniref:penicillin-binding protein activator LpoB n=1 Tax=Stutzerimonas urumqiensis TaxID=638269 RepID=UPI000EAF292C|nr:penicillin-binding protein activator LpoB [Stutzerimonas urumqiensis]
MRALTGFLLFGLSLVCQASPKIVVTDLAYEERISGYIHIVNASSQAQINGLSGSSSSQYNELEATYSYLEQGELKKFTGDIKGAILKSRQFELVQGKPHGKQNEGVYDVIARIRNGDFKGADYVLFGSLSDLDFRQDLNDLQHTDSYSKVYGLTLVADFSLVDTRTYKIVAAFTATGEGKDVKLINAADVQVTPNRGRVVRAVSQTLGDDVARQLQAQLSGIDPSFAAPTAPANSLPPDQPAQILR